MSKKILITGGTGLLGSQLTRKLIEKGHHVSHLSRNPNQGNVPGFKWDPENKSLEEGAFDKVDSLIHLAGAGVADKRWSVKRKAEVFNSRVEGSKLLFEHLTSIDHQVGTFISASAIGYYGIDTGDTWVGEEDGPGSGFLADLCVHWERAADQFGGQGIRTVKFRIGVILSPVGGALKKLVVPIKLGVGALLGSGDQYMSWIHLEDLCELFIRAIEDPKIAGTYNAVAPQPLTNREFTRLLAKATNRPLLLPPVPSFVLKLMLGEMASIVLGGNRVSSKKIETTGFDFQFANGGVALKDLLKS
ncbi:MAG: TIGR01777 family oxidoreductase [Bacteroidetes bacterium]|nr:TIGR01777 family oxidoreductase [Bacteroidota bacterium]